MSDTGSGTPGEGDPTQAVPPVDDGGAYDATQALPPTPGADPTGGGPGQPGEPYDPYAEGDDDGRAYCCGLTFEVFVDAWRVWCQRNGRPWRC